MPRAPQLFQSLLCTFAWLALPLSAFGSEDFLPEAASADASAGDVYTGPYVSGAFQSLTFVNDLVGWRDYFNAGYQGASTVIANVESGLAWYGHEAFVRPSNAPTSLTTFTNTNSLNQLDFHATMVGHVLAGSGYVAGTNGAQYTFAGLGMASEAALVSAGVATSFSASSVGSFSTSYNSVITPYKAFFTGTGTALLIKICSVASILPISAGRADQSNATAPAVWGEAILVPLMVLNPLFVQVERTPTPGALRSGFWRPLPSTVTVPRLLNEAIRPLLLWAPTVKVAGTEAPELMPSIDTL
jgi:hypothetical protein